LARIGALRGAQDLLSVALQYGNAFEQGMQSAALKPTQSFGDDTSLYLMELWRQAKFD